jgi:acyl dehydratase
MASVEELQALVGQQGRPTVYEVDRSMLRLYADTIDDKNPKWQEVMHPGLLAAAMFMGVGVPMEFPYPGIVDAGLELQVFKPIKAGDTITITNELSGVEDKSSERGKRLLISMKSGIKNQNGEEVAASIGRVMNLG